MFQPVFVITASLMVLQAQTQDRADQIISLSEMLNQTAQSRAEALTQNPAAPSPAAEFSDPVLTGLTEFALAAHQLSRAVEHSGGPMDLRCIFRGMSEDANRHLEALSQDALRADHARTYREIARLTAQAGDIAADPEAQAASAFACASD